MLVLHFTWSSRSPRPPSVLIVQVIQMSLFSKYLQVFSVFFYLGHQCPIPSGLLILQATWFTMLVSLDQTGRDKVCTVQTTLEQTIVDKNLTQLDWAELHINRTNQNELDQP